MHDNLCFMKTSDAAKHTDVASLSKGERTAQRLLDAAERLFGERGFEGTTLRDVAGAVGIREPGIYNHFANKEALYCAVLERGLRPMADAMDAVTAGQPSLKELAELPEVMTDLLALHPYMPALFQQALMSSAGGPAQGLMDGWLDQLFARGQQTLSPGGDIAVGEAGTEAANRQAAIRMIAMFNLCSGYFLSQKVLDRWQVGSVLDAANLEQQKKMLGKIVRLFMLE